MLEPGLFKLVLRFEFLDRLFKKMTNGTHVKAIRITNPSIEITQTYENLLNNIEILSIFTDKI